MAFLAAAAPYIMMAGTAMSAYGMYAQGQAQYQSALFSAKRDEANALNEGRAAVQAQEEAQREVDALKQQRMRILGEQAAAASKSGLTISGSVTDAMNDTAIQMETEIQMAKYRGAMNAYNSGQRASSYLDQATMTRYAGKSARNSANLSAAGTIISGASRYGSLKYGNT